MKKRIVKKTASKKISVLAKFKTLARRHAKVAAAVALVAATAAVLASCGPLVRGSTPGLSACVDAVTPCQFEVTQLGAQGVRYTWFVKALGQTSFQTQVCEGTNCQGIHNFVCDANTQSCADAASFGLVSATRTQEGNVYKFTAVDSDPLLISVTDSFAVRATANGQTGNWISGRVTAN